jgi:6-phosphofructokinase 2
MARVFCIALNPAIDVSSDAQSIHPMRKIRTCNEKHYPGGGGVNVARVVCELGLEPELLYLSGGVSGVLLEQFISQYAIREHHISTQENTRIAYTVHEKQTGFEYRFVPEGPEISESELREIMDFIVAWDISEGDLVVASGSLPRGVPVSIYSQIATIAKRKRALFVLDSSGAGLSEALSGKNIYLVKPSLGELEKLVGIELDEKKAKLAAMDLVNRGSAQYVAVSMGAHGAFLASRNGVHSTPAVHVKLQSAVGAGDSFLGAMVFSLAQGNAMSDAFRLGVCAGAAAVMTKGTELCKRSTVFDLYRSIDPIEQ